MDTIDLKLVPFCEQDLGEAYKLYKQELYNVIQKVFGWDEDFQIERFKNLYRLDWFHWIEQGSTRVGYICFYARENEIHVSLLIIFPNLQRKQFGGKVMNIIKKVAGAQNFKVTLSSFKENEQAVKFYQKLGYKIVGQDEHFFDLILDR